MRVTDALNFYFFVAIYAEAVAAASILPCTDDIYTHYDHGVCLACTDGSIRLAGSTLSTQGRVEICFRGQWGTVCDDLWDNTDARVVCRQLGLPYTGALARSRAAFGQGTGPIFLDNVRCGGTEAFLTNCPHNGVGIENCGHYEDAGVVCQACTDGSIRLAGSTLSTQGRVEICFRGQWGTVCDDLWDNTDARVVCRQLGLPYTGALARSRAAFGQGTGAIFLDNVRCGGTETFLTNCPHNGVGIENCGHYEDAGVVCQACTDGSIRLAGSTLSTQGRVEICFRGQWGTVCDDFWDNADARVVCRQLGLPYTGALARSRAAFGQGTGAIFLDNVRCGGTETFLTNCPHNGVGIENCGHYEDAGVVCQACTDGSIRLAGSTLSTQGRVEICFRGQWGTVCHDLWDNTDARVVCRQLGLPYTGALARSRAAFGQGTGPIFLDNVRCGGTETFLTRCSHNGVGVEDCSHSEDAGVVCQACTDGSIRLAGSTLSTQGRVEICFRGQWGTVCDDLWDDTDARVVCRQLGLPYTGALARTGAAFGQGTGPIFLDNVGCGGTETFLTRCSHNGVGVEDCGHSDDAGVVCQACTDGSIRLAGSTLSTQGRVEICFGGVWGTVCDASWDNTDAIVVCRQLGLPYTGALARRSAAFGQGTGPIFLDNVRCGGTETFLTRCSHNGVGIEDCGHSEDAGVVCRGRAAAELEEGCSMELFVLAATQEQERREVVQNVQNVLPSIFPVPETPTEHESEEEPLRMVYNAIAEEIGVVESDTGYTQFVEAVTEITEAHREACSGGTDTRPGLADVPRLAREFGSLPGNARNAPELRNIFGKLLCIKNQVEEVPSTRKKRQEPDPCEDVPRVCPPGGYEAVLCVQEFFACLDDEVESREGPNATRVRAVFGFVQENFPCLGFVVDTTGSMREEIAAVQDLILTFISGEENEPGCYALTPFNDHHGYYDYPDYYDGDPPTLNYGPVTVYDTSSADDLKQLRNDTLSLYHHSGGDWLEYGMSAMNLTLFAKHPIFGDEVFFPGTGSQLILLTDAGAKDDDITNYVIQEAMIREVCIHVFLSSSCGVLRSYEQVATQTGGTIACSLSHFNATLIEYGRFVNSYRDSPCSQFYEGGRRRKRFSDERCHTFRVSAFTTVLKFLVRTDQPQFNVTDPSGRTTMRNVRTEFVTYEQTNPQTGEWSVCVETGTLSISFNNRIVLDMVVAYVKEDDSAPNRVVATSEVPPACSTGRVAVFTSRLSDISDTAPIHLNLLEDGTVRQSATFVKCGEALTGNVTFPLGSFTYQLEGEDQEGNPFLYNSRKRVELQTNNNFTLTVITGPQEVSFQASVVLNFTLQNHNSYGSTNLTISVGRVAGFLTRLQQIHISLDAKTRAVISLDVIASSSTIVPGSTYRFTVTAADGCISQSASQTVRVREIMIATEAPDACGCQNGGTCTRIPRRGRLLLRCRCPPQYGGAQCQIRRG